MLPQCVWNQQNVFYSVVAPLPAIFIRLSVIPFSLHSPLFSFFCPLHLPLSSPRRAAAVFLTNLYVHIKLVGRGKSVALGISLHPPSTLQPQMANTYATHTHTDTHTLTLTHTHTNTQLFQSVGFHYLIATLGKFVRHTRRMRNAAGK